MPSPLKSNIVLKAGDERIAKDCQFPSGIHELYILPLYQDLLDSALAETTLSFVKDGIKLQLNGTFFIQFRKDSLNTAIRSNHFL
jgi:hypothetical protein